MASEYSTEQEQEQEQEKKSSRRSHRDGQEKFDQEVRLFTEDPAKLAREILSLKKELNRLHFKVKSYQESNRSFQLIFNIVIVALLAIITYRVFTGN
jgi:ABC-type lipoprotein release transport system permease subunit